MNKSRLVIGAFLFYTLWAWALPNTVNASDNTEPVGEKIPGKNQEYNQASAQQNHQAPVLSTNMLLKEEAFKSVQENLMPLSPDQIQRLRNSFDHIQRAAAQLPGVPPKPSATSQIVNLAPGATPPVVRLSSGFVTSVVFVDATGAPWPIKAYDVGDPNAFNIQWDKQGNTLLIQATTSYKQGNLAIILRKLNTPVMLTLMPGQGAVDYRVDMQVPRLGPNPVASFEGLPSTEGPQLLDVLNGIAPFNAKELIVKGAPDTRAWLSEGKMFLRTPLVLVSPSWISKISGSDALMHAYLVPKASVVLALHYGKMVRLTVEEK